MIENYFIDTKMKYFIDGSYNYNAFPPDIRSNSILERYNKIIKTELGSKRNCNWVIFLNFINKELDRINEKLSKNENINVLYESKQTKFGINKFINNISDKNNDSNQNNLINQLNIDIKYDISKLWLKQNANNCRYNAFITLFYFTISPFLYDLKDNNLKNLNILNDLILNLSKDVNKKNYNEIIIFLQKNKYDTNNSKIDEILKEEDEEKKFKLIEEFKIDDTIDLFSSGYAAQLFSIFNNKTLFCFSEIKKSECIICGKKKSEELKEKQPFTFININNINNTNLFNIFLNKYKEIYSYACDCRKNLKNSEDVLYVKIKYDINIFPTFIFLLFDFQYNDLINYKDNIYKLIEDTFTLPNNMEYKLLGMIAAPNYDHYNTIIFNPIDQTINSIFTPNKIYYHDGQKNDGKIMSITEGMDLRNLGIPYIVLYKKLNK